MTEIVEYFTEKEKIRRESHDDIIKSYLSRASLIIDKKVTPNRVMAVVAREKKVSIEGVRRILKKYGVYESVKKPVAVSADFTLI